VLIVIGIGLAALLSAYLLQRVGQVLLVVFAGVLLAIAFDGLTELVQRYTSLRHGWSLLLVLVVLLALISAMGALLGPHIVDQLFQLAQRLPEAIDNVRSRLQAYQWGRMLLHNIPAPQEILANSSTLISHVTGAFSTALGALANVFVMLVIGIYMAVDPDTYARSAVYLLPPTRRHRARVVMAALAHALRRWFAGRLASMALVGLFIYIGLSLIGVPLALALGLITALLEFVPYLGPFLALIPAVLVAMLESPVLALYVLPLYAAVQIAEGYLITPLIEKRAVSIPPAYLIVVQVLGGVLAGAIGVVLAEPLAVVVAIMVQMLYVEDILGDSVRVMGESPSAAGQVDAQARRSGLG
jgi:predicted PurR-regulated permease PerM